MISPLLTDLYQLTMAYGYWKLGLHEREAVFHLIFRKNPFRGNYAISCGLATVIEFLKSWHFTAEHLYYLKSLSALNGERLFPEEFLEYLKTLRFTCTVDAIPEGTVVLPHEPLLRIKGPLIQGQLLESTLLNIMNFQTLIATKAARVCEAAKGDEVLEFGLRRAQGPDGALAASRAAYVGGVMGTSNLLAGKLYDIPVRGTHAHSWVTAFPDELSAFSAYASVMPHNCTFLVDTYDSVQGVKNAITIAKKYGVDLQAIRLDSGDMVRLSIKARELLDAAGLTQTKIIASNDLDEYVIADMKKQGAKISVWGVGTHLVTSYDHPALDGVYKLSALRDAQGEWQYKLKLSEQTVKISNPGIHQVRRFFSNTQQVFDVMFEENLGIAASPVMVSLDVDHVKIAVTGVRDFIDLLKPVFLQGELIYPAESIHHARARTLQQVAQFSSLSPLVGLEQQLFALKQKLISDVTGVRHE